MLRRARNHWRLRIQLNSFRPGGACLNGRPDVQGLAPLAIDERPFGGYFRDSKRPLHRNDAEQPLRAAAVFGGVALTIGQQGLGVFVAQQAG